MSFGAGVDSVALGLWLIDHGIEAEWVYADHGGDWPETREYVEMLKARGYPVTILETRRNGLALYDYYLAHHMVPMRWARACTVEYKLVPLSAYMQPPCEVYIGIDAGEAHRIAGIVAGCRPDEEKLFPLAEWGIDRAGCIEIIQQHGLPVPIKSGCFCCPFQRASQWRELYRLHPDLFCRAQRLEDAASEYLVARGRQRVYLSDKDLPLATVAEAGQTDLFDDSRASRPCLCEL